MEFAPLPAFAAWTHRDVRSGFEVLFSEHAPEGIRLRGSTTAVEQGSGWTVGYDIELDASWQTRRVRATNSTGRGAAERIIERVAPGRWTVDGTHAPHLDGCHDVDFESSSVTNTVPVHRLRLPVGETVEAPAAFVRAEDLAVIRLEQQYTRTSDEDAAAHTFDYYSATFDFRCELRFDASGLILDYPGIAVRHS